MTPPAASKAQEPIRASQLGAPPGGAGQPLKRLANEDRLLMLLVLASALIHLVILVMDDWRWKRDRNLIADEVAIDIDLMQDLEYVAPTVTTLPKAEVKAPEAKAPENMLPQAPKRVAVDEPQKKEEEEPVPVEKPKEVPKEEPKKPDEEVKAAPEKKEEPKVNIKQDPDAQKLALDELKKRQALDALREMQKTAKTAEAPEEDPKAQIADELAKKNKNKPKSNLLATAATAGRHRKYGALLNAAVRQNYSLPEVYNLKGANMKVLVNIAVNDRGELAELAIEQSSGDSVFDDLTLQAVRASVPLPKPPSDLIGETITLVFTP